MIPAIEHFEALVRKHPENTGWYSWYALRRANGSEPAVLIGAGGFFGPPTENATVEIGYSIVPTYERRGFASELVQALVTYALGTGTVHRIIAHTTPGNVGSIRVLEKSRFQFAGTGREPGTVQYTRLPADG
jgi:RimJ/RimL family protein N-acetyltransferase